MTLIKDVAAGLLILLKYDNEFSKNIEVRDGFMYAGPSLSDLRGRITEQDVKELLSLGWSEDVHRRCWSKYI